MKYHIRFLSIRRRGKTLRPQAVPISTPSFALILAFGSSHLGRSRYRWRSNRKINGWLPAAGFLQQFMAQHLSLKKKSKSIKAKLSSMIFHGVSIQRRSKATSRPSASAHRLLASVQAIWQTPRWQVPNNVPTHPSALQELPCVPIIVFLLPFKGEKKSASA